MRAKCSTCGKNPPRADRRTCDSCAAYQRAIRPQKRIRQRAWLAKPENRAKAIGWKHSDYEANPEKYLFQNARSRAKRAGAPFSITADDVHIPNTCPLLGIPIVAGKGTTIASSPSLDRIDPQLGYVPGNVWVISHRANGIKHDATLSEARRLVGAWALMLFRKTSRDWFRRAA